MITPSNLQPIRSANDTPEFRRNYSSFEYVNALYALDNGWTGKGVEVGVIDDGVFNPELNVNISPKSKDFGAICENGTCTPRNNIGDAKSTHGTPVAGIIAAPRNGEGAQGIAPEASLVILRVDSMNSGVQGNGGSDGAAALDYAGSLGIKIVNRSLSSLSFYGPTAQAVRDYGLTGGLLINSAGNYKEDSPREFLVGNVTAENRNAWLFAVSVNTNGTNYSLAGYSNKCGEMRDRCVAGMGDQVTTQVGTGITGFGGTSAAAPQVAGLAALILQKWPQLTGQQAGQVIMRTARDIGEPGVDAVFGHGLIDVRAALAPVNPTLGNGTTSMAVANSVMVVNPAFNGGALRDGMTSVTLLDEFGRDFNGSLGGLVVEAAGDRYALQRRMALVRGQGATGFMTPGASATMGYATVRTGRGEETVNVLTNASASVRRGRFSINADYNSVDQVANDVMGLAPTSDLVNAYNPRSNMSIGVGYALGTDASLYASAIAGDATNGLIAGYRNGRASVKLSYLDESGSVFGTPTGAGALNLGRGASTAAIEVANGFDLGDWAFDGYASFGWTRLKIDPNSLLTSANTLRTSRLGVTASRSLWGGRASLGLVQPLTTYAGAGTLTYGQSYDLASASLVYGNRAVDLSGNSRLMVTGGYELVGERSALRLGAVRDLSNGDTKAMVSYNLAF